MKKVLLISGKAGSGKDTVANIFQSNLIKNGNKVLITHYADLLKYILKTFFDWDGNKDERGRHLLQYVGTDIIRAKYPDFWVGFISKILELFPDEWDIVIIPDCRFPNEIEILKEQGLDVSFIRVRRPEMESKLTEEQKQHASETALNDTKADFTILNSGTLDELNDIIAKLCIVFGNDITV